MSKIAILEECLENEVALEGCLCGAARMAIRLRLRVVG